MRLIACLLAAAALSAQSLPLAGLAYVGFRVSDLAAARNFYSGLLGFEEAYAIRGAQGEIQRVAFKVNDEQFIELLPGLKPDQDQRLAFIAIQCTDLRRAHRLLVERGLKPSSIATRPDGNPGFWLEDPGGTRLEFLQYVAGSQQHRVRGKFLGTNRISDRLWHTGVVVLDLDAAMRFYATALGFRETWRGGPSEGELRWINMEMPGRGDYIEYMLASQPPTRQQLGSMQHICLQVPDIKAAYEKLRRRGLPDEPRYQPRIGRNGRWLANLFDPDGSRTEIMEPQPASAGAPR
jgi:lactoylglutathione lyase